MITDQRMYLLKERVGLILNLEDFNFSVGRLQANVYGLM